MPRKPEGPEFIPQPRQREKWRPYNWPIGNAPLASDLAKTPEAREFLDFMAAPISMDTPFVLPEGVPQDRVDVWRQAFERTIKDPDFLADAGKLNFAVNAHTWRDVEETVSRISAINPGVSELGFS